MSFEILHHKTQGLPRKRTKRLWVAGLWIVPWVLWSPSSRAEVLYDKEGIQLRGTAGVVTENAATCHVLEASHTEAAYEQLKANDGQPVDVWRLEYSVHNRTGRELSYLRADFQIESEWPPCTNWTGEGPGDGETGGPYPTGVSWGNHRKILSAPYGMVPEQVLQEVLYLAVFHTDKPTFERWSTHFTFGGSDPSAGRPGVPAGRPAASPDSPGGSSDGPLPPEVMLDRYLLEVEMLSEEKDHKGALEAMERIVVLQKEHGVTLPEEFPFRYAQAAMAAGSYQAAIDSVNRYLSATGRGGEHYREALAVLVKSDRALREPAGVGAEADSAISRARRRATPGSDMGGVVRAQPQARQRLPFEPEMVEIPGGSFRMGCISGLDCSEYVQPVHEVRVETFALGKYEVTFEEYDRFTAATGRVRPEDQGWGRGRRPVINVSWGDAVAYTRWLSQQTGQRYRLPTEAEWEYAARAGSVTKYSWGNEIGRNRANGGGGRQWNIWKTAPVGSFAPTGWGLHDMHGNVWEWVQDCPNNNYHGAPTDGSAWESGDCSERVYRGGSWRNHRDSLSSANRAWKTASHRNFSRGFRVARTSTP